MNAYPRTVRRLLDKCKAKPKRTVHFDGCIVTTGYYRPDHLPVVADAMIDAARTKQKETKHEQR